MCKANYIASALGAGVFLGVWLFTGTPLFLPTSAIDIAYVLLAIAATIESGASWEALV